MCYPSLCAGSIPYYPGTVWSASLSLMLVVLNSFVYNTDAQQSVLCSISLMQSSSAYVLI